MDPSLQPALSTAEDAKNVTHPMVLNLQSEVGCGSSTSGTVTVDQVHTVTVKKEDDVTGAEDVGWGTMGGGEKSAGAVRGKVDSVSDAHRRTSEVEKLAGKRRSNKGDSSAGENGVHRAQRNRRCKKSLRQEEVSKPRRSLRHARDDDLADLHVRFGDAGHDGLSKAETAPQGRKRQGRPESGQPLEAAKTGGGWRGRKAGHAQHTLNLGNDVWEQWKRVGVQKSLGTHADVAAFLVTHFFATDVKLCTTCQSPLQLLCPHCPPSQSSTLPTLLPLVSSPPSLSPHPSPQPSRQPPPPAEGEMDQEEEEEGEEGMMVEEVVPVPPEEPAAKQRPRRGRKRKAERQSHMCSSCGATFERAAALKVHMRKHTGEKPFQCTECDRAFSTSGQLVNHGRKHSGERPYICTVCSATFPIASSLKQHVRIHTGDRPYACHVCEQRFCYRGDLTAHVRKHTGDRPFLCSDCGKSFAMSSHLSKHKRIHSGYRPFECNVCHKTFPFLNRLTLHMRTHTGEKPFLCADCGSSFIRASTLTIHRRIHHTFEKPCICPYCGHAFADSANLSKHKKNKHGFQKTGSKHPTASGSRGHLADNQPTSGKDPAHKGSGTDLAETPSSSDLPGQMDSGTQLVVGQPPDVGTQLVDRQSSDVLTRTINLNPAAEPSPANVLSAAHMAAVTNMNMVGSVDKTFSDVFTLATTSAVLSVNGVMGAGEDVGMMSGDVGVDGGEGVGRVVSVSGGGGVSEGVDEGPTAGKSDSQELHELKPMGVWKTFPFAV